MKAKPGKVDAPREAQKPSRKRKLPEEPEGGDNKKAKKGQSLRSKTGVLKAPDSDNVDVDVTARVADKTPPTVEVVKAPDLDAEHSNMLKHELDQLLSIGCRAIHVPKIGSVINLQTSDCYSVMKELKQCTMEAAAADTESLKVMNLEGTPITNIYEIFADFAEKSAKFELQSAWPRDMRLATMCSGTEAPLLAMQLMKQATARHGKKFLDFPLDFTHVFSVEIEPFKQAYIERNFSPPLLFRDVTEFKNAGEVHTAYGGTAPQPQHVNILVAGSACVDFSSLNNQRSTVKEGESTKTLNGINEYIKRHRPNMVILENVKGFPWEKQVQQFRSIDYAAQFLHVDTKNFYLPQTRQRGYLVAFDKCRLEGEFDLDKALEQWVSYMFKYQKRANAPFTDFICDDDDPRLHEARSAFEATNSSSRATDWAACRQRHANYRIENQYGSLRPMTHWQNNGSCLFPDFGWIKWAKLQRERIWDTLDIRYLSQAAERNYDMNYKARWLELSQNVDRDSDAKQWGIVGCLTPTGQPYLTSRGGPVSGFESLILQGIPIDYLNLNKETTRQLQDLAGNAMSVPVVNAAILSGILAIHKARKTPGENFFSHLLTSSKSENASVTAVNTKPKAKSMEELKKDMGRYKEDLIRVDSLYRTPDIAKILEEASKTLRFCKCEGTFGRKEGPFRRCKQCGHMTCMTCGHNPTHEYCIIPAALVGRRMSPAGFMKKISEVLPTTLCLSTTDASRLADGLRLHLTAGADYEKTYLKAATLAFGATTLTFRDVKRGHSWKVTFEGPRARLELRITRKCSLSMKAEHDFFGHTAVDCYWLLFAKPLQLDQKSLKQNDSELREALQQPIAQMIPGKTLLSGEWKLFNAVSIKLDITTSDNVTKPSWESSIGLQKKIFKESTRPTKLHVGVSPLESDKVQEEAKAITGIYALRPDCGGASGSMHVRNSPGKWVTSPVFLFLDPEPLKNATADCFVFSTSNDRTGYKEYRPTLAKIEPNWRPAGHRQFSQPSNPKDVATETTAVLHTWISCSDLSLRTCTTEIEQKLVMPETFTVSISENAACRAGSPLSIIILPVENYEGSDWKHGQRFNVPIVNKREALQEYSWLLKRATIQMLEKFNDYQRVELANLDSASCSTCAPELPSVICAEGKGTSITANEDKNEATKYEQSLKQRPPPIIAVLHCGESFAALEIRLNIPTLCHRVLAKMHFSEHMRLQSATLKWWMEEDHGRESQPVFAASPFLDNSRERPAPSPAKFFRTLWPAQHLVLAWMVGQETNPCEWYEKEREEVYVPALGCRINVEARAPKEICGGVLADEVGGGKTTTSLALIAKMLEAGSGARKPPDDNSIFVEATLILVPPNLITQWKEEADKCFDDTADRRLVITDDSKRGKQKIGVYKLQISDLKNKDIIIAPWSMFDKNRYWKALAGQSKVEKKSLKSVRAFQEWLQKVLAALPKDTTTFSGNKIKGASLLHAVTWRRIIIDEYSILEDKSFLAILALQSLSRWLLSGTPPTSSFDAVNATARLLKTKLTSESDEPQGYFKLVTKGTRLSKEKTLAEQFLWFHEKRSPAWVQARNRLANEFIAKFFRKNSAEAAQHIVRVAHYEVLPLSAHEHITYFEVTQRLMSQPFKFSCPSDEDFMTMTRRERIDKVIAASLHTEDALLSCCSELGKIYSSTKVAQSASEMCTPVVQNAEKKLAALIKEIWGYLREAFGCEKSRTKEEDPTKNPHFNSYKIQIIKNGFGDMCASRLIDRLMLAAYKLSVQPTSPYERRIKKKAASKKAAPRKPAKKKPGPAKQEPEAESGHSEGDAAHGKSDDEHGDQDAAYENFDDEHGDQDAAQEESSEVEVGGGEMKLRCEDLSTTTIDIIEQIRLRRVFKNIQTLISGEALPGCAGCCQTGQKPENLVILGICGHIACKRCLNNKNMRAHDASGCLDRNCGGPGNQHNLIEAAPFADIQKSSTPTTNTKMDAVVEKVKEILKQPGSDAILVFVQFSRVRAALIEAFETKGIDFEDASTGEKDVINVVEAFRKGTGDARVLVLDINSADAAGW